MGYSSLLAVFSLVATVVAQGSVDLTSTGCADPSGFDKCHSQAANELTGCLNQAQNDGNNAETLACGCTNYQTNYNCYATYCWNRVWECEYQLYIVDYLDKCPTAKTPVPYYPIPDGAPDACECNVGEVYSALFEVSNEGSACLKRDGASGAASIQACECCELSGLASTIVGICPQTDPSLVFWNVVESVESSFGLNFNQCGATLSQVNCVNDLGYSQLESGTYYSPNNFPAEGTNTLANGPGTVTAPASGSVFTYTDAGNGQVYTVTAASVKGGSGGSGGAGGSGGSGAATTTTAKGGKSTGTAAAATGSSSGSGAAATTSSSSNTSHNSGGVFKVNMGLVASLLLVSSLFVRL